MKTNIKWKSLHKYKTALKYEEYNIKTSKSVTPFIQKIKYLKIFNFAKKFVFFFQKESNTWKGFNIIVTHLVHS